MLAVGDRPIPVDVAVAKGSVGGACIGDNVRGRECDAVEGARGLGRILPRLGERKTGERAVGVR